ncbi:hypothetical protein BV911_16390 [Pseudoruegeria sp. SK021]|nr:hypothetical protein BV911_16390 [Pseudoruegeria sp. SK021]
MAAAFAAPLKQSTHLTIAETLGGWIVIAILHRPLGADVESLVKDACSAFRLLKRSDISLLPAFDLRHAKSLKDARNLLVVQEAGDAPHKLLLRARPIRALLDAASRDRATIERNSSDRKTGVRIAQAESTPHDFDGLIDYADTGQLADPLDEPDSTARADAPEPVRHLTRSGRSYDDRARDQKRTRVAAMSAAMQDLALPASVDLLTDFEARTLLAEACAAPSDAALTAVALSLIYGRSVDRLRAAFEVDAVSLQEGDLTTYREVWHKTRGGAIELEIAVDLPAFVVDLPKHLATKVTSDGRERLRLGVPKPFQADQLVGFDSSQCDAALKALRGKVSRPYTQRRITGWLAAWLRNRGADQAAIGVLTGQDPDGRAQMHYTQLKTTDLNALWGTALSEGLGLKPPLSPRSSSMVGSRQRLPRKALIQTFKDLSAKLDLDRGHGSPLTIKELAEVHERFTLYTLELLKAATGHRPVDAPFENITDFDLEAGLLGIADKAVAGGRSERIVALPPSAITQVRHWIGHLEALRETLEWRVESTITDRIVAAQGRASSTAPLFFFLSPEGAIIEPRRHEITQRRRKVLPVQTNLSRHMLRTHLASAGVAPDAIDASFGHARLGEEPWGAFATLSISDLRAVAMAAEEFLQSVGLTPCVSPLEKRT